MYKTTFKGQDIEEDKIDFESLDYKNIKVRIMQYSHHKMNRYESCNKRNDCCD